MKQKMQYHRLSLVEREEISRLLAKGLSFRAIAKQIKRNPGTIAREVNQIRLGRILYRATVGQWRALRKRLRQRRKRKLDKFSKLKRYVLSKLILYWSPEQIANHVKIDYPEDTAMRISPETIYAYVYVQPKGELKKHLIKALRREHKHRYKKNHHFNREVPNIIDLVSIDKRPKEVGDRRIPGHWEGDLIIGKLKHSALGSLVERTSRAVILTHLKQFDHTSVAKAFAQEIQKVPRHMRLSMTYDRGGEMSSHRWFTKHTKVKVYFAHSKSPWERGTNENTNGLIRQFFPKGTDFSKFTRREVKRVQRLLNQRPRKVLHWKTPEEVFNELVLR